MDLDPGSDELEEPRHDVDLHVEILEGTKQLECLLVRVVREGDDHALDVEEADDRREPLDITEQRQVLETLSALLRLGVHETDEIHPVLRMDKELLREQLADVAGTDDDGVLDIGLVSPCKRSRHRTAFAIAFVCVGRAGARTLARRNAAYVQNTVIVGAGEVGQLFARKLLIHPEYGMNLVGFVDAEPKERREGLEHLALLGDTERLPAIIRFLDVERVIVAFSNDSHEETLESLRSLKDLDVQIDIVPRLFEFVGPGVEVHTVEGLPLIGLPPLRLSRSSRLVKRTTDLALTIPALIFLAPLLRTARADDQDRLAGPCLLSPDPDRRRRPHLSDLQVPVNARGRRRAQA